LLGYNQLVDLIALINANGWDRIEAQMSSGLNGGFKSLDSNKSVRVTYERNST